MKESFKTLIIIPGIWKNSDSLEKALITNDCLLEGLDIKSAGEHKSFNAWSIFNDVRTSYAEQFSHTFPGVEQTSIIMQINSQLIIDVEIGSLKDLKKLCKLISSIVKAGGLAVDITDAQKIILGSEWEGFSFVDNAILYSIFLKINRGGKYFYTTGMGYFLMKDVQVEIFGLDLSEAMIQNFVQHMLIDNPILNIGSVIQIPENGPRYLLTESNDNFSGNIYGSWLLVLQDKIM